MKITGKTVRVFPNDTNTDEIISGKYKYDELDLNKLAQHTFEAIDKKFYTDCVKLDEPILVAGANFGCGSSREQAPQVLRACGISCIVAESFARIFYRNGFNIGLPLIECDSITKRVAQGDVLTIDFDAGSVANVSRGQAYQFRPIPSFMQRLLQSGGLMRYLEASGGYTE